MRPAEKEKHRFPPFRIMAIAIACQTIVAVVVMGIGLSIITKENGFKATTLAVLVPSAFIGIILYAAFIRNEQNRGKLDYVEAHSLASAISAIPGLVLGPLILIPLGVSLGLFWLVWPRVERRLVPTKPILVTATDTARKQTGISGRE
jgi:hypothetical protein